MSAPTIRYPDGTVSILSGQIGTIVISPVVTPPGHTLECNGAAISRSAYAKLFEVLGTTYGAGDGTNTFNLPDFRGRFLRGVGGNSAAIGVAQGDGNKFHKHVVSCTDSTGSVTAGLLSSNPYNNNIRVIPIAGSTLCFGSQTAQSGEYQADAVGEVESRPVNMAVKYCIIFE